MLGFSPFAFILPCLLFLFMLIKIFKARSSNALKLPPGPKKLPLIGNLHQLISPELPHHHLNNLAKTYGPIYHLKVGELTLIILATPEIAREVLKKHEINFAQKPLFPSLEMMGDMSSSFMYAPYGEYWRQLRKICVLELLSVKSVRSFQSIREDETSNLVQFVRSLQGCPLNLTNKITSCLNAIISRAAFGQSYKHQEYLSALKEAIEQVGGFNFADVFPSLRILRYVRGRKWRLDSIRRRCDQISNDILNDHRRQRENLSCTREDSFVKEDFVDVLLRIQESNELGFPLTDNHIKSLILEFFGGGTDTTSVTVEWAMSELLKNPQVMANAQAEVREALKGKDQVQDSDLEDLKYLKSVIKETLRLHPPVPLVPREARKSCKIKGYDIPAKSRVLIHAGALGRDPNHWEDPEKFQPERFLESPVDFIGTYYHFIPFGFGRRVCPGIAFAMANIELLLALLLYHFDWALPDGQTPEELDMIEDFAATVRRKSDLYAIATLPSHGHASRPGGFQA
ncbi:desmethyl-deoxy-podophyllotoxin synthase-like [Rhodamnia argentea]|uniref:Desmethyl-deoxy-podophyllotoxin synthase-like n=1 Tax=Rhodamnia argentea TaxID=178133 RepID=A0A8B8MNA8_9MYRT|nr:desmethyl-deoxy-podophyllotoxin synthase-like [Rhodamnia argentea]